LEDVFQPNLNTGVLLHPDGRPCLALALPFIQGIYSALEIEFGDAGQDLLYRCGFEWGLQEMLRLTQQFQEDFGPDGAAIWQRDPKSVFDSWWHPLQISGWGTCDVDFSRLDRGIIVADVRQSVFASALEPGNRPVCHHHAGLLAGALSFLERAERHATEIQCRALGDESCQFVVGPGSDVDAAESARQKGVGPADIARRLG
jgi:predicted hydrocarbon binding protein